MILRNVLVQQQNLFVCLTAINMFKCSEQQKYTSSSNIVPTFRLKSSRTRQSRKNDFQTVETGPSEFCCSAGAFHRLSATLSLRHFCFISV